MANGLIALTGGGQFDLPLRASESSETHPLKMMYFVARPVPKVGKPYVLAGVVKSSLRDGDHTYLMVDVVRCGGELDGEVSSQLMWLRDLAGGGFNLFKDRNDWLAAVKNRLAVLKK